MIWFVYAIIWIGTCSEIQDDVCPCLFFFWKSAFRSHIPYPTRPLVTTLLLPSTYLFISFKKKKWRGLLQAFFFSLSESAQSQTRLEMRERRERLFFSLSLSFFLFFPYSSPAVFLPVFFSFLSLGASHV